MQVLMFNVLFLNRSMLQLTVCTTCHIKSKKQTFTRSLKSKLSEEKIFPLDSWIFHIFKVSTIKSLFMAICAHANIYMLVKLKL